MFEASMFRFLREAPFWLVISIGSQFSDVPYYRLPIFQKLYKLQHGLAVPLVVAVDRLV